MNRIPAVATRRLPVGGLRVSEKLLRRWRWRDPQAAASKPVRCKRDACYLVRAVFDAPGELPAEMPFGWRILLAFGDGRRVLHERFAELSPWGCDPRLWFGWVRSPQDATHVSLMPGDGPWPAALTLHPVAEPDIRSHPLAHVPPWSQYEARPPMERIVLPASRAGLEPLLRQGFGGELRIIDTPRSLRALAREVVGAAWVFDPAWAGLLSWRELRTLAEASRVVVDLDAFVRLTGRGLKLVERSSDYDMFSARVEYADFATRGFALQDVFAWCTFDGVRFSQRVIRRDAAWRRFAQREGFCTLLTNETPWENRNGDIVAALRDAGTGQLVVSDAAMMAWGQGTRDEGQGTRAQGAGRRAQGVGGQPPSAVESHGGQPPSAVESHGGQPPPAVTGQSRATGPHMLGQSRATGPHLSGRSEPAGPAPIAPRLAGHLLRMMLGLPIEPAARYRVREPEDDIVVRDIADLARHYPPLRAVRWRSRQPGVVELGLWLPGSDRSRRRAVVLATGRIDRGGRHTGWPPEPMMLLLRRLATGTAGWQPQCDVFWEFSSACGTRYATLFEAAPRLNSRAVEWIDLTQPERLRELPPSGCAGDGSLEQQAVIERLVRRRVKNAK